MKLRFAFLLLGILLGLAALSGRDTRTAAQTAADVHPVFKVPADYGQFRQFVLVSGEYWSVFEANDGTVRVVKLRGAFGDPFVTVEIQRK